MKGTEKQINWAKEIISNPVNAMEQYVEWAKTFAPEHVAPVTKAIDSYNAMIAKGGAHADDAAFIIDHRARFSSAAKKILTKEFTDAGIHPCCPVMNISDMFKY